MLSIRKLMSVVKDVDLEAMPSMPSSIFVNDDNNDDDEILIRVYALLNRAV